METCPKCNRPVASLSQWHYCVEVDMDTLFEKKDPVVGLMFERLILAMDGWDNTAFSATCRCIVFVTDHTYLIAKPMKKALDLHFYLPEPDEDPPVYKCQLYSGRYVHWVRLHDEAEIDARLMRLIRQSYEWPGPERARKR